MLRFFPRSAIGIWGTGAPDPGTNWAPHQVDPKGNHQAEIPGHPVEILWKLEEW